MSETTIAKPLSGTEAVKAILYDVERCLLNDADFAPHASLTGLSYTVSIKCHYQTGFKDTDVKRTVTGERGDALRAIESGEVHESSVERESEPPNETRLNTDQPIPVLVDDGKGGTREEYKSYTGKDEKGRNKLPVQKGRQIKNVVKGA